MNNEQIAYEYFVALGLTPAQAAGIVGNLLQESGLDPESVQQGGPGRGIAQWSEGGRWQPGLMTGNTQADLMAQLNYIWQELNTSESQSLQALRSAGNATQAADIFEQYYERAGIPNNGAREAYANNVLTMAQTGNWQALPASMVGNAAGLGGYSGGTVGSGTNPVGGGNTINGQPLTMSDIPAVVQWIQQNWGSDAWLLNIPQVATILEQAAVQGLSTAQVQAQIEQTQWWKTTSASVRQYLQDLYTNPADYSFTQPGSKAAQMFAQVVNESGTVGVQLTGPQAQLIALDALKYGWSNQEIQAAIGSQAVYQNATHTNAQSVAQQLSATANQYYQTLSPQVLQSWMENIAGGTQTMQQFQAKMAQDASMKWTGYSQQLLSGYTMQQLTDNLRQEAGKTMEVDPNSINFTTDPMYQKILDYVPPSTNAKVSEPHRVMTLSEMDQYLKGTQQWGSTQQARDQAAELERTLLQTFGKVANG